MKVEIRDTAIRNLANGLKMIEHNMKYWSELAEDAKRDESASWMAKDFEMKAEMYRHELFSAEQVLCELGEEFYNMVKAEMESN